MKWLAGLFLTSMVAPALVFYTDEETTLGSGIIVNEISPTGAYAGAGWQHQVVLKREGANNSFLATIISPKHFIAAAHIATGTAGTDAQRFITHPQLFNGVEDRTYTMKNGADPIRIEFTDTSDPSNPVVRQTDLFVFEIWETFPDFAEIYTGSSEASEEVVVTGFGDGKGAVVQNSSGQDRGWEPDVTNRKARWGTNTVDGLSPSLDGNFTQGLFLRMDFDPGTSASATIYECSAMNKDSSGGWFVFSGGEWKLAGITRGIETYGYADGATGNRWAIYDAVGLYHRSSPSPVSLFSSFRRTRSYATRISEHQNAIEAIIDPAKAVALLTSVERFEAWVESFGATIDLAASDDPDGDGRSNLEEYFIESDPLSSSQVPRALIAEVTSAGAHRLTLTESLDIAGRGLTVVVQQSADLLMWDQVPMEDLDAGVSGFTETSNVIDASQGTRTRVLEYTPPAADSLYYRVKVGI